MPSRDRAMAQPAVTLKKPYKAAFLAWLIPGMGHYYQGRKGKALLYAGCILGLFVTGLILGEGQVVYWRWINPLKDAENFRFSYLCQFFVGLPALPALIQETIRYVSPDVGPILGGWLAGPIGEVGQNAANALHPRLGKLVEGGSVYTMMAGLLNILAIYDAFDGPAYAAEDAVADAEAATSARVGLAGAPGMEV